MKKRIFAMVSLLVLCSLLITYGEREYSMELVDQNIILFKQCKNTYSYKEIKKLASQKLSLMEFGGSLGVQNYKYNNGNYYIVIKTDEGFFILWFDSEKCYLSTDHIIFSDCSYYHSITSIKIGDDLDTVRTADKTGQFNFLYHSWSLYPKISYHYFKNGKCFVIMYDERNIVEDLWSFTF